MEISESWKEVDVEKREIDVKEEERVLLFRQKGVAATNFAGNNFLQSIMERCVTTWHNLNMML